MAASKLLKTLYTIQSKSGHEHEAMIPFLESYLSQMEGVTFQTIDKNIYITKGEAETYPCICAHHDQATAINNDITVIEHAGKIIGFDFKSGKPCALGADDKNGIFLALLALYEFPVMKACFFHGEETGCNGSKACDMSFFDNVRYVVQCDRKGNSDFIINANDVDLSSEEFETACEIEKFGYKQANGKNTDVKALKERGLKVSCVNLSCGYEDEHTDHETCTIADLEKCWFLVKHILSLKDTYPHEYTPPVKTKTGRGTWTGGNNYSNGYWQGNKFIPYKTQTPVHTDKVGKQYTSGNPTKDDIIKTLCSKIATDYVSQKKKAECLLLEYHEMVLNNPPYDPQKNLMDLYEDNKSAFINLSFNDFSALYTGLILTYESN